MSFRDYVICVTSKKKRILKLRYQHRVFEKEQEVNDFMEKAVEIIFCLKKKSCFLASIVYKFSFSANY